METVFLVLYTPKIKIGVTKENRSQSEQAAIHKGKSESKRTGCDLQRKKGEETSKIS